MKLFAQLFVSCTQAFIHINDILSVKKKKELLAILIRIRLGGRRQHLEAEREKQKHQGWKSEESKSKSSNEIRPEDKENMENDKNKQ